MTNSTRDELLARCDTIEATYEFMLAYAAQGLDGDAQSKSGGELRNYLDRTSLALDGLADLFSQVVDTEARQPSDLYATFIDVLEQDARKARAAVRLVLAQPSISSQLIDNMNASIHVRTLLTDLFLLDEVLKPTQPAPASTSAS